MPTGGQMAIAESLAALDERRASSTRRRGSWVIGGLGALLLAVVIGFMFWAAHYQPLEEGPGARWWIGMFPGTQGTPATQAQNVKSYGTPFVIREPKPGTQFGFVQMVHNTGPFAVTITAISNRFNVPDRVRLVDTRVDTGRVTNGDMVGGFMPFEHMPVRPSWNDLPFFRTTLTVPACAVHAAFYPSAGSGPALDTFTVTYRFLWFSHSVELPIHTPLTLIGPKDCGIRK
jgi:hypothetical protein